MITEKALSKKEHQDNFIKIFSAIHGVSAERAQQMYEVEKFNFLKIMHDKPDLQECSELSQRGVFLDVISAGLSFSPASGLVYLQGRSRRTGQKTQDGKDIYERVLEFQPSPKGKVYLCQRVGSIERITEPVAVFADDYFKRGTDKTGTWLEHVPADTRNGQVIASYCYVVYPGGHREPVILDQIDIERRRRASERQNGKKINGVFQLGLPNPLYTAFRGGIDPGFFGAKVIDAATKYLRKQEINSIYMGGAEEEQEFPEVHFSPSPAGAPGTSAPDAGVDATIPGAPMDEPADEPILF